MLISWFLKTLEQCLYTKCQALQFRVLLIWNFIVCVSHTTKILPEVCVEKNTFSVKTQVYNQIITFIDNWIVLRSFVSIYCKLFKGVIILCLIVIFSLFESKVYAQPKVIYPGCPKVAESCFSKIYITLNDCSVVKQNIINIENKVLLIEMMANKANTQLICEKTFRSLFVYILVTSVSLSYGFAQQNCK